MEAPSSRLSLWLGGGWSSYVELIYDESRLSSLFLATSVSWKVSIVDCVCIDLLDVNIDAENKPGCKLEDHGVVFQAQGLKRRNESLFLRGGLYIFDVLTSKL